MNRMANKFDKAAGDKTDRRYRLRFEEAASLVFMIPILFNLLRLGQTSRLFGDPEKISLLIAFVLIAFFLYKPAYSEANSYLKTIRDFAPLFYILVIYSNLPVLIQALNPKDADHILLAIDQYLFGMQLSVFLQEYMFEPLITFSTISYAAYYFFPPVLAILFYVRGNYGIFRKLSAAVFLSFFLGYIGYVITPAVGPRYVISDSYTNQIGGSEMSQTIRQKLDDWEYTKRDCFPSLHNAAILVALMFAIRYERKFALFFLPFALGLFWATVYLRYHYLIDVIAGWLLAIICYFWGPQIYRWWDRKPNIPN